MREHTYRIEVERRIIDTYEVKGSSSQASAMRLGEDLILGSNPPVNTREVSRKIGRPVKQTGD